MEDIKPSLMNFVTGEDFFKRILVVESADYLKPLRERFPAAEIFFVTADIDFYSDDAKIFLKEYGDELNPEV